MKEIKIEDFITIRILELNTEDSVYFVDNFNEKYFYVKDNNELCTHQSIYTYYKLYFQKARIVHCGNLEGLKKEVYKLYGQLTFTIPRAKEEQDYYFISTTFEVRRMTDFNGKISNPHYKAYNYFLSEEEATKYAKKLQSYLIESRKEDYLKGE